MTHLGLREYLGHADVARRLERSTPEVRERALRRTFPDWRPLSALRDRLFRGR